jgi:hypothetical protein
MLRIVRPVRLFREKESGAKRFFPEKKIAFSSVRCYIDMMDFFQP